MQITTLTNLLQTTEIQSNPELKVDLETLYLLTINMHQHSTPHF